MRRFRYLTVVLLLGWSLTSCGKAQTAAVPSLQCTDRCVDDPSNSYEIYVPAHRVSDKLPVLVILDPHGSGKTALQHFLLTAERDPVILVASNKVQNNLPDFQAVIQALIADVRAKYPVGTDLYLVGFSGGARMAVGFAESSPVKGLILSGALAGAQELKQVGCPVYSISGTDDFNFMETAQFLFQEELTPSNLLIELTRSSHGWPDSLTLADAYTFVRTAGSATTNEAFEKRQLAKIDRLNAAPAKIMARWTARNLANTLPFSNNKAFATLDGQLKASPAYADEMKRLLENLQMEAGVRDGYIKAFDSQKADWWTAELAKVNRHIETASDPFQQDAYRRIKGFWGIVCFSLCNRAAGSGDLEALRRYVSVYRVLEPQNPDMLRFSKLLN